MIEKININDALQQNAGIIEGIVGIPTGFATAIISTDGIRIMYHRKSDNLMFMAKPHKWAALQANGEVADGVVIIEGGKVLVVAPNEASTMLIWSSAAISGGGITTADYSIVINDWEGKANTDAQIAASISGAITNTASYAPGFCNLYANAALTAGKWWLPSMGELMMIYANLTRINYALSLIAGATQVREAAYWCSTECSSTRAWHLNLMSGYIGLANKVTSQCYVRAVSTLF
ncbi:hypothetical protein [Bacteroides sp. UBA939]|uniref:hypothetical protein n=1 Tax=Bacteroides sp. UBA939 TaxID=1946092 RepID=UPI0025C64C67|nr:hypothetical protein [Bacteroides sp. UBA939]